MRVRMQSKGGEGTVAEDAAVTSEETKPTEAENEVRGVAEPAPRLKNTSFFEEIRRALAEAKKDPTVTADLLNDIRALQTTGRAGRPILKAQTSKHRVHPCGMFRMGDATHYVRDEWMRYECLRRLFARLPSAAVKMASLASLRSTPGTMAEFADALRDWRASTCLSARTSNSLREEWQGRRDAPATKADCWTALW